MIPEGSIRLDSMSSVDMFADSRLLSNIRTTDEGMKMKIVCNAGAFMVTEVGDLSGCGTV